MFLYLWLGLAASIATVTSVRRPTERPIATRTIRPGRSTAWLNPRPRAAWREDGSVGLIHELMGGRMYPLTLSGIETMTRDLVH